MGIRFARGNDGAAYVLKSDPRTGNTDDRVEVTAVSQVEPAPRTCFSHTCKTTLCATLASKCLTV